MKKIIITLLLLLSLSQADSVLLLKKGWQLIGSSTAITDMSQFRADNVEEIWHFDAATQQWMGYSPDSTVQTKMTEQHITPITTLQNWHGFWVNSKQDWALTLNDNTLTTAPSDTNSSRDIIQLKTGWNLISLPVDTVVSADIFKDMTVWKYNHDQQWELFDTQASEEDFPHLGSINNADGIWVKAPADTNISIADESAKLHNFATTEAMESYIQEMVLLNNHPYWGIEPLVFSRGVMMEVDDAVGTTEAPTSEAANDNVAQDATGTNLQESGVDESDIVKHNGVNVFYTTQSNWDKNTINITTFSALANGNTQPIQTITFDTARRIDSLYLVDNKLVVLSNAYGNDKEEIASASSLPYPGYDISQVLVDIFDVTDINDIQKISSYKIDGVMVTSRVVNHKLYLVSSFNPRVTITYPKDSVTLSDTCKTYFEGSTYDYDYAACYNIMTDDGQTYYRYDYDHPTVTVEDLTPEIEDQDQNRVALITPSRLYASAKKNQSSTMTTISEIDISNGAYQQSNSFIGNSYTQYASTNAFYLVSTEYPIYYDFNNYKTRSTLYKFNLDENLNYQGIGSVYGTPINQFALSEYRDIMRIATTDGFSWSSSGTNNSIYTLKEENSQLKIQGILSGLGKAGETLYAVRFMGDKGYVVTFRQTDPLYTIDLSDPTSPQKVGELHVNGYSSYLHPVGEDKLLGIGRDATAEGNVLGLKLELFDISDFANPTSLDSITYSSGTYSELEYNHKALAYRSSDDLFAFPYRDYENDTSHDYLGLYQIKEDKLIAYDPVTNSSDDSWWGEHRGIIFDLNDSTYAGFFAGDTVQTEKLNTSN